MNRGWRQLPHVAALVSEAGGLGNIAVGGGTDAPLKPNGVYLLAGDGVVVSKAGQHTHGLGRFYSSLAGRPISGLSFLAVSLIDVEARRSYPLQVEQHLPSSRPYTNIRVTDGHLLTKIQASCRQTAINLVIARSTRFPNFSGTREMAVYCHSRGNR
jgi:hypothetical protein